MSLSLNKNMQKYKKAAPKQAKKIKSHTAMDKVKIKRVKRAQKKISAKEKILAGLGLGSTLIGGAGAVAPQKQSTEFVRTNTDQQGSTTSKIKSALSSIFGVKKASAAVSEAQLQEMADAVVEARDTLISFDKWVIEARADADNFGTEAEKQNRLQEIQDTIDQERPGLVSSIQEAESNYSQAADEFIAAQNGGGGDTGAGGTGGVTGGGAGGNNGGGSGGNADPGTGVQVDVNVPSIDDFYGTEPQYDYAAIENATTATGINNSASTALGQISTWKSQEMQRLGTWNSQQNTKVTQFPQLAGERDSVYQSAVDAINQKEQSARGQVTTLQATRLAQLNAPPVNTNPPGPAELEERQNPAGYTEVYYQGNWVIKNGETIDGSKIGKESGVSYGSMGGQWILKDGQIKTAGGVTSITIGGQWVVREAGLNAEGSTVRRGDYDYLVVDGKYYLKDDQTKVEGTNTYKSSGGVWVVQSAPVAPQNGDTRTHNGVAQVYQRGSWYEAGTPMALDMNATAGATATIDGVRWEVKNGVWVRSAASMEQPQTTGGTVTLTVVGGTLSDARVGQNWTLVIKGAPGDKVYANGGKNGVVSGNTLLGTIGSNGELRLSGTFSSADIGAWQQTYLLQRNGNDYEIGHQTFNISATGAQTGGANLVVAGGTLNDAKVGQQWTLKIKGTPGAQVYAIGGKDGEEHRYTQANWVIPASGELVLTGTFAAGDVGAWQQTYITVNPSTNQETQVGAANFNISAAATLPLGARLAGRFHAMGLLQTDDGNGNLLNAPAVYVAQNTGDGGYIYGLDYEGAQLVLQWMKANGYPEAEIVEQKRVGNFTAPIYYISIPGRGEFLAGGIANEIIRQGETVAKAMIGAEIQKGSGTPATDFQPVTTGTTGLLQVTANSQIWSATPEGRKQVGTGTESFNSITSTADNKGSAFLGGTASPATDLGSITNGTYTPTGTVVTVNNPGNTTQTATVASLTLSQSQLSIAKNSIVSNVQATVLMSNGTTSGNVTVSSADTTKVRATVNTVNGTITITAVEVTGQAVQVRVHPAALPVSDTSKDQILLVTVTAALANDGQVSATAATLSSISPASASLAEIQAAAGLNIVISGSNFNTSLSKNVVKIGSVTLTPTAFVLNASGQVIGLSVKVPSGLVVGNYGVTVTNADDTTKVSNTKFFAVTENEAQDVDDDATGEDTSGNNNENSNNNNNNTGNVSGNNNNTVGNNNNVNGSGNNVSNNNTGANNSGNSGISAQDAQALRNQVASLQNQVSELSARLNNNSTPQDLSYYNNQIAQLQNQINQLNARLNGQVAGQNTPGGLRYDDIVASQGGLQMPGSYSSPVVAGAQTQTYTVKKGDTLWALSKKYYGDGRQWRKILDANPESLSRRGNVRTLRIGAVLVIPQ